jgi:glutaredoxin
MISKEEEVYRYIKEANSLYRKAYEMMQCPLCKNDIKLLLEAGLEVENIAKFAAHTHKQELDALRKLAIELDRLHLLNALVKVYKVLKYLRIL